MSMLKTTDLRAWYFTQELPGSRAGPLNAAALRGAAWDRATLVSWHPTTVLVEVFPSTRGTYCNPHSFHAPLHGERHRD